MSAHLWRRWLLAAGGALTSASSGAPYAAAADCRGLTPPSMAVAPQHRHLAVIDDLLRLRDIGLVGEFVPDRSPFSISPDGKQIAFALRRADPASNGYCQGLYVKALDSNAEPRRIDAGGEYIRYSFDDLRGLVFPTGSPIVNTPAWSADGKWIAYLKRTNGPTQVWLVAVDGTRAFAATREHFDIDDVRWTSDGHVIFSGSPALSSERAAIASEALTGYHFDRRIVPMGGPVPYPRSPVIRETFVLDPQSSAVRAARADERLSISSDGDRPAPLGARLFAYSAAGGTAWAAPSDLHSSFTPSNVYSATAMGGAVECKAEECRGNIVDMGWSADGTGIWYIRRQGPGDSLLGLYLWRPSARRPRRVLVTPDVLGNCAPAGRELICLREAALSPRYFAAIDLFDGAVRRVLDLNPEFATLRLGRVRRLTWQNDDGLTGYGDLILPPGHRPGQKHPLVIVQYRTRGFLRGAVGDLYPMQAFAARGLAVLSLEGPPSLAQTRIRHGQLAQTTDDARQDTEDWSNRRNVMASLLHGLSAAVATGSVDATKVGVSGTSEGAVSAWFAVLNAPGIFRAASIGSCCTDPKTLMPTAGVALQSHLRDLGYPGYLEDKPAFWSAISIAQNARKIKIPMLIQIPDEEFGTALETFTSLKEAENEVDLYVFPKENHYIWQPAHRKTIYTRNVEWFCAKLGCSD